jgi:hypothetical protein
VIARIWIEDADDTSLEKMLCERAGLLGMAGISGDTRVLHQSTEHAGIAAVHGFANAMTKYAGAYVAALGGLGALMLTAGRRAFRAGARGPLQQAGVVRRDRGPGGQRGKWTTHFQPGRPRVGVGHPDQRRTDDCLARLSAFSGSDVQVMTQKISS